MAPAQYTYLEYAHSSFPPSTSHARRISARADDDNDYGRAEHAFLHIHKVLFLARVDESISVLEQEEPPTLHTEQAISPSVFYVFLAICQFTARLCCTHLRIQGLLHVAHHLRVGRNTNTALVAIDLIFYAPFSRFVSPRRVYAVRICEEALTFSCRPPSDGTRRTHLRPWSTLHWHRGSHVYDCGSLCMYSYERSRLRLFPSRKVFFSRRTSPLGF